MIQISKIKWFKYISIFIFIIIFTGCAKHYVGLSYSEPYGFFSGILHGIIFPFALIGKAISWILSIFDIHIFTNIQFVGQPNTGLWFYYIGYFFGLTVWAESAK